MQALGPHIFGVAAQSFRNLIDKNRDQAVLISGESGAGKTESTKLVLLYITQTLKSNSGLEDQLLQLNPILESFGNAKTVRNDNSSRLGKWIQITMNPTGMTLDQASVTEYLLELTRLCGQAEGERGYHIFYQMTTESARGDYPNLKLGPSTEYKYLKQSKAAVDDNK